VKLFILSQITHNHHYLFLGHCFVSYWISLIMLNCWEFRVKYQTLQHEYFEIMLHLIVILNFEARFLQMNHFDLEINWSSSSYLLMPKHFSHFHSYLILPSYDALFTIALEAQDRFPCSCSLNQIEIKVSFLVVSILE